MRTPRSSTAAFVRVVLLAAGALVLVSLAGCLASVRKSVYSPVYLSYEELRRGVAADAPVEMSVTGKIYVWGDWVLVNEVDRGIHVVDNSVPTAPVVAAFIPIPGNVDMAVVDDILYADSYVDLVAIDISDPLHAVEVARVPEAFPYPEAVPFEGLWYGGDVYETVEPDEGIVVGWEKTGERVVVFDTRLIYAMEGGGAQGTGGSMARMTLLGDYLYTLHNDSIVLVDVSTPAAPVLVPEAVYVGWDIETIFPAQDKLYIGSATGLYIYDAAGAPDLVELGQVQHVTSCDPVVVQGDRAYVTLRAGSACGGGENLLLVIDVADPRNPTTVAEHALDGPYGLAVDGDTLFVCDGASGLKVLDVTDPDAASLPSLAAVTGYDTYDVIVVPPLAIVVGPDGLYQYDITGLSGVVPALELLSHITVTPPLPPDDTEAPGSPGR